MTIALTDAGKQACLSTPGLSSKVAHVSLHSADPAGTGANETTAARQVPSFTYSAGHITLSATDSFTGGAANGAVQFVGLWDASATPVFLGSVSITSGDLTFNAAGSYNLTNIDISI